MLLVFGPKFILAVIEIFHVNYDCHLMSDMLHLTVLLTFYDSLDDVSQCRSHDKRSYRVSKREHYVQEDEVDMNHIIMAFDLLDCILILKTTTLSRV